MMLHSISPCVGHLAVIISTAHEQGKSRWGPLMEHALIHERRAPHSVAALRVHSLAKPPHLLGRGPVTTSKYCSGWRTLVHLLSCGITTKQHSTGPDHMQAAASSAEPKVGTHHPHGQPAIVCLLPSSICKATGRCGCQPTLLTVLCRNAAWPRWSYCSIARIVQCVP